MPHIEGILKFSTATLVLLVIGFATAQPTPKFEVASIKAGCGNSGRDAETKAGGAAVISPGRFNQCGTLKSFIQAAYGRFADGRDNSLRSGLIPIEGSPNWATSDRYQISAKPEGNQRVEIIQGPMLQALLEERFKLKIHRETREVPAYALTMHLEFAPDQTTTGLGSLRALTDTPADPTGGLSSFTAIQQQLGLKLESAKGPREFLVIDHIERPSEN